jgi:outer membrane immunogenic protein
MRALSLAAIAAVVTSSAFAADLAPEPAPVELPEAFNWTGFYAGVHGGYGWAKMDGDYFAPVETPQPDGFFGGGQVGYNFEFANKVVLGVEADAAWADLSDDTVYNNTFIFPYSLGYQAKVESFGTVRARAGYAIDRFLPYVTGGFAWANTELDSQFTQSFPVPFDSHGSDTQTFTGWTVGAGFEYAFAGNVTAKVEYLYADLGSKDFHLGDAGPFPVDLKMQTAKLGLNYKF